MKNLKNLCFIFVFVKIWYEFKDKFIFLRNFLETAKDSLSFSNKYKTGKIYKIMELYADSTLKKYISAF